MTLKGKKVLVTGATGFLGGHIAEALIQHGAKVYFTYRNVKKDCYFFFEKLDKKARGIKCGLEDLPKLKEVLKKNQIKQCAQMEHLHYSINR